MISIAVVCAALFLVVVLSIGIGIFAGVFKDSPGFFFTMLLLLIMLSGFLFVYNVDKKEDTLSSQIVDVQTATEPNGAKYSFIEYRDFDADIRYEGQKVYMTRKFGGLVSNKKASVRQVYNKTEGFYGPVRTLVELLPEPLDTK